MEILEAFDATGWPTRRRRWRGGPEDGATLRRQARRREPVGESVQRPKLIDPFLPKIEELVETSEGVVRADVVHERLVAMGFGGDERTTRRAVATIKAAYATGIVGGIGRGSPSRGCGCSSTGALADRVRA